MEVGWWRDGIWKKDKNIYLFLKKKKRSLRRYIKKTDKEYDHYNFERTFGTHPYLKKKFR